MQRFMFVLMLIAICSGSIAAGHVTRNMLTKIQPAPVAEKMRAVVGKLKDGLARKALVAGASLVLICGSMGCSDDYDDDSHNGIYHNDYVAFFDSASGSILAGKADHTVYYFDDYETDEIRVKLGNGDDVYIGESEVLGWLKPNHELVGAEVSFAAGEFATGFETLHGTVEVVYGRYARYGDEFIDTVLGVTVQWGVDFNGDSFFTNPTYTVFLQSNRVWR